MHLTNTHKKNPDWPRLIKKHRLGLGLSMAKYGRIYGVTRQAVFQWEKGLAEAPNRVLWDIVRKEGK